MALLAELLTPLTSMLEYVDEALIIMPEGQDEALYSCLADVMTTKSSARCSTANSRYEFLIEHLKDIFGGLYFEGSTKGRKDMTRSMRC